MCVAAPLKELGHHAAICSCLHEGSASTPTPGAPQGVCCACDHSVLADGWVASRQDYTGARGRGYGLHLQVVNKLIVFRACIGFECCFRVGLVVGNNACGLSCHMPGIR